MPRQPKKPPQPPRAAEPEDVEPLNVVTSAGDFTWYREQPPYIEFLMFRSEQDPRVQRARQKQRAGEELAPEDWHVIHCVGTLKLSIDEDGFIADLYLDREYLGEDEVEGWQDGVDELLGMFPLGANGGDLTVWWTEEIANYTFTPDEDVQGGEP